MSKKMNEFNRRNFLRLGAATTLTIPFLESMFPNIAEAANASGSLKRIIFYNYHQSWLDKMMYPQVSSYMTGAESVRYVPLSSISGDLSKIFTASKYGNIKSKMNIMRGFDILTGESGDSVTGGHNQTYGLSCTGTKSNDVSNITSIDMLIANSSSFYSSTPFKKNVNVVPTNYDGREYYSFSFENNVVRTPIGGPTSLFKELFLNQTLPSTGGTTTTTPTDTNMSRRLAMNNIMGKLTSLASSSKLSASDQQKLKQHADYINKILPGLAAPSGGGSTTTITGCSAPTNPSGKYNESESATSGGTARIQNMMDQVYMALNCQLTNVVVMQPFSGSDSSLMATEGGHPYDTFHQIVGHFDDNGSPEAQYVSLKSWIFDQLLYLVNKMEATKESNGLSMLDNSLVVVVGNDGSSTHSKDDMGMITFGSLGGLVKTGNYINYKNASSGVGRPLNSVYTTLLNLLKISHSGFGSYADSSGKYSAYTSASAKQSNLPVFT